MNEASLIQCNNIPGGHEDPSSWMIMILIGKEAIVPQPGKKQSVQITNMHDLQERALPGLAPGCMA